MIWVQAGRSMPVRRSRIPGDQISARRTELPCRGMFNVQRSSREGPDGLAIVSAGRNRSRVCRNVRPQWVVRWVEICSIAGSTCTRREHWSNRARCSTCLTAQITTHSPSCKELEVVKLSLLAPNGESVVAQLLLYRGGRDVLTLFFAGSCPQSGPGPSIASMTCHGD